MQNQIITKPGYKLIPHIGEIPTDWSLKKLGELAQNKNSTLSIGNLENNNGNYKLYGASGYIKSINFYDREEKYISIVKDGAGVGRVSIGEEKSSILGTLSYIDPKNNVDFNYLFYILNKINYKKYITGSTIPHVYFSDYSHEKVAVPNNIKEQNKIGKIINTCDSQIETTKQIIQKIEIRNKGLQQQLLTGKKRLPGFSEDWSNKHLSEIFDRVTRKNSEGNDNVLTISAQKGLINQENFFNKQVASKILNDYFLLYKGEFAYNKSYSNGYPMGAIKRLNDYDKGVVTTLYICFSLKEELDFSSNFFEKYFEFGLLIKGLTEIAHEGGRAHGLLNVTPSDFFNLKVHIPNPEEQKAIANILDKATEQLNEYKEKLKKLELQKKGLMQQLLTGKTRVKV